ncbi:RHS repeat-associated core domain-containing protein [archaeon]|jgi:RHS repeat-associated protein|nr:RHS repeat-associated core domain-containing protein [archaeon]
MKESVLFVIFLIICMPVGFAKSVVVDNINETEIIIEPSSITRYVYGLDGIVASMVDSEINYFHSDRIKSNRLITDYSGFEVSTFKSLPFGQEVENNGIRFAFATGKELDPSDLYYFGARYYDSNSGRFTSVDPVKENHAYSYVDNNPMNLVDPTGESFFEPSTVNSLLTSSTTCAIAGNCGPQVMIPDFADAAAVGCLFLAGIAAWGISQGLGPQFPDINLPDLGDTGEQDNTVSLSKSMSIPKSKTISLTEPITLERQRVITYGRVMTKQEAKLFDSTGVLGGEGARGEEGQLVPVFLAPPGIIKRTRGLSNNKLQEFYRDIGGKNTQPGKLQVRFFTTSFVPTTDPIRSRSGNIFELKFPRGTQTISVEY